MSNRLAEIRQARGLSQRALAELAHTSDQQISRLEGGQRQLTETWMRRLSAALGCEPHELLAETRRPPANDRAPLRSRRLAPRTC